MLITFSGLDGSGKSTLVEYLKDSLERQNKKVVVSHMNYDVGLYSLLRAVGTRFAEVSGDAKTPAERTHAPRDRAFEGNFPTKSAKLRYRLVWNRDLRFLVYSLDVLIFFFYRVYVERIHRQVLIMDRYFYDTVVDITGARRSFRTSFLSWLAPAPDLPIYLDCEPEKAFGRKNEYSVDFLNNRRLSYLQLISGLPGMVVISTDQDLDATRLTLAGAVHERMCN